MILAPHEVVTIATELVVRLNEIDSQREPGKYRTRPEVVKLGVTRADVEDTRRPAVYVVPGESRADLRLMKGHQFEFVILIVAVIVAEDPIAAVWALVKDIEEVIERSEFLKTAEAPAGLVAIPLRVTDEFAVVDEEAESGTGTANITVVGAYRRAHA